MAFLGYKNDGNRQFVINHIDGNKINNHVSNLEIVTHRENVSIWHRNGIDKDSIGVEKTKNGTYRSRIYINGKNITIGTFKTKEKAHNKYMDELNEVLTTLKHY